MKKEDDINLHKMVNDAMHIPDLVESLMAMEDIRALAVEKEAYLRALPDRKKRTGGYIGAAASGGGFATLCGGIATLGVSLPELAVMGVMLLGGATAMAGHHIGEKIGKRKGEKILKGSNVDLYEYVYIHAHIDKMIEQKLRPATCAVKQIVEQSSLDKMAAKYPDLCAHFVASASEKALPPKQAPVITAEMLKNSR